MNEDVDLPECDEEAENEFVNPFWEPKVIVIKPCKYCWLTNTITNPYNLTFMIVVGLLALGMTKMLCGHICCRTKDGRPIDVVGILLGTTNQFHTRR